MPGDPYHHATMSGMIPEVQLQDLTEDDLECDLCPNQLMSWHGDSLGITTTEGDKVCMRCFTTKPLRAAEGQGPGRYIDLTAFPTAEADHA